MDPDLKALYQEIILDHSKNPNNYRILEPCDCHAHGKNPNCGDEYTVYINLNKGKIADISFSGEGCAISKASGSIMTHMLQGQNISEIAQSIDFLNHMLIDKDPPRRSLPRPTGRPCCPVWCARFPPAHLLRPTHLGACPQSPKVL
jgi:nitrogen fixation NifU-like protein